MKKFAYAENNLILKLFLIFFIIPFILVTVSWIIISTTLPSQAAISAYEPSLGTKVYDNEGKLMHEFYKQKRKVLKSYEIPELVKETLIAVEDNRYYEHSAIDIFGIFRALAIDIIKGKIVQGASTITQQLARNMYLSHRTTIMRKIKEIILAFKIEMLFSKEEILTNYLNVIYFSNGAYGVGAAAQTYYDKEVEDLTIDEIAMIIALAKGSAYSPYKNPDLALKRRNFVLYKMYDNDVISKKDYFESIKKEIEVVPKKSNYYELAPYYVEEIRRRLIKEYGDEVLYNGGLKVYTAFEPELQEVVNEAVELNLEEISKRNNYEAYELNDLEDREEDLERNMILKGKVEEVTDNNIVVDLGLDYKGLISIKPRVWTWNIDPQKEFEENDEIFVKYLWHNKESKKMGVLWEKKPFPQAAFIAMDPENGYVNALIGGADYRESQFNRAVQSKLQIGSTVKPFFYAAAIDSKRFTMASTFVDAPFIWELPQQNPSSWKPENYGETFRGEITLSRALAKSINVVSAKLMKEIGPQTAVEYMHKLGIESDIPAVPALSVGIPELSPLEVARAYSTFANLGNRVEPIFIRKIYNRNGELIKENKTKKVRVLSKQTAYIMISMMKGVYYPGGTADILRSSWGVEGIVAGKSGTTNDSADLWLTSLLPYKVLVGWMGFDYKDTLGEHEYGTKANGEGFAMVLKKLMEDRKFEDWERPPGLVKKRVDPKTGLLVKTEENFTGELFENDENNPDKEEEHIDINQPGRNMFFYKGTEPTMYGEKKEEDQSVDFSDF